MRKKSLLCWLLATLTSMATMIFYVMGCKYFTKELCEE